MLKHFPPPLGEPEHFLLPFVGEPKYFPPLLGEGELGWGEFPTSPSLGGKEEKGLQLSGWNISSGRIGESTMIEEFLNQRVVVDLRSEYVCLGTLQRIDDYFVELRNADMHDLRDSDTTRENYVAESLATGIKRNRRRLLLVRSEIVAISRLEDVVES